MLNIEEKKSYRIGLHHLGFRPFFLLAGLSAVLLMLFWAWFYHIDASLLRNTSFSVIHWHAHEMIFGYTLAVVAGFLLTAVRNWTGVQTLHGLPLMLLALLWLLARLAPFVEYAHALSFMAIVDLLFNIALCLALLHPILKIKQWLQLSILLPVMLITLSNAVFYLGLLGHHPPGLQQGLYAGLYLIILLILLMGRRVIPFFIEKGVEEKTELKNYMWLDVGSIVLLLSFIILQVFTPFAAIAAANAGLLFLLHGLRLVGWHTPGIWRKPLLWILFIAYGWITAGFGLTALAQVLPLSPMLALHAFAYGGIGLMTIGMMARVALGHTGRNVFDPPSILKPLFLLIILGSLVRVVFPMLAPGQYALWIGLSQLAWILAFGLFCWIYAPMLIKPRVDGRYG